MGTLESPKPLSSVFLGLQALGHKAQRTASLTHNSQSLAAAWGSRLLESSEVYVVYKDRRTIRFELLSIHTTSQVLAWSRNISCLHPDSSTQTAPLKQVVETAHKFLPARVSKQSKTEPRTAQARADG